MYHATNQQLIYLRVVSTTLLLLGGIAWGIIGSVGFNPISRLCRSADLGSLNRLIYLLIGVSAVIYLYFFYNKQTFLPFLSESLFPSSLISITQPMDFNHQVTLKAPADAKMVVYWTSSTEKQFENASASKVVDGNADLYIKEDSEHFRVYYRWIKKDTETLSEVQSVLV